MKVLLRGGSHSSEDEFASRKNPLVVEKGEEEEERGGGFMLMVYDLQGEPKMFRPCLRASDPGVAGAEPRDAHDLTGREIMLVSALTRPAPPPGAGKNPQNPPRNGVQDHGQRRAEVPAGLQRGSASRFWHGGDREGGRRMRRRGSREEVSGSQAAVN